MKQWQASMDGPANHSAGIRKSRVMLQSAIENYSRESKGNAVLKRHESGQKESKEILHCRPPINLNMLKCISFGISLVSRVTI